MTTNDLRWFDPTYQFQVGEIVMMTSCNFETRAVPVTKVGRKLLHVQGWGQQTVTFRLDVPGRPANDAYGHEAILTVDELAYQERVIQAATALRAAGVEVARYSTWPVERLEAILFLATNRAPIFEKTFEKENQS